MDCRKCLLPWCGPWRSKHKILYCDFQPSCKTDNDLVEGGPAVSIGYDFGGGSSADPLWGGYLNFLVKTLSGGTLGFSPKPGNIAGQAVTMNTFAFGSGAGCPGSNVVPEAPYNLGRTVTHELGHFLT